MQATNIHPNPNQILMERIIDASPDLIFKAWTSAETLDKWYCPKTFTCHTKSFEFKEGGIWQFEMVSSDGTVYPSYIKFKKIKSPSLISYSHGSFAEDPEAFESEFRLELQGGKTKISLLIIMASEEAVKNVMAFGVYDLGLGTLEKLNDTSLELAEKFELRITKTLKFPQQLVYDCMTKAEHLANWWGTPGVPVQIVHADMQKGGYFHYFSTMPNGNKMYGRLDYLEVQPNDLLCFYNAFADEKGNIIAAPFPVSLPLKNSNIWTLRTEGENTIVTLRGVPAIDSTPEQFDNYVSFRPSMEQGFGKSIEQMINYLESLA